MKRTFVATGLALVLMAATSAFGFGVSLDPVSQTPSVGTVTSVDVNLQLSGGESLFGFNLLLNWMPEVLSFNDLTFGSDVIDNYLLGSYGFTAGTGSVAFDGADVFAYPFGPTAISGAGTFTLATVYFSADSVGVSPLNLSGTLDLGNMDPQTFERILDPVSAQGSIAPVPEPGTLLLLGSGIVGLAGYRRRVKKS